MSELEDLRLFKRTIVDLYKRTNQDDETNDNPLSDADFVEEVGYIIREFEDEV